MSRFRFELATETDDADLRSVLRETPMEGRIGVTFQREPSWFAAAVLDGDVHQVVACRDLESGRIVGFGCRSIRQLYVDGEPRRIGYLSSLRLLPEFRNRGLVVRGYAYFRQLHSDGQTPYYLTTIADGNAPALSALTSARAGLPRYMPVGKYHTLAIPRSRFAPHANSKVQFRRAAEDDLTAIVMFLQKEGPRRQFFPVVDVDDFGPNGRGLRGLLPNDLHLAEVTGQIIGVVGAWDLHPFKQSVVVNYGGALRWTRPGLNVWARLRGRPTLPKPGQSFHFHTAALPAVLDDSAEIFRDLLLAAVQSCADGQSSHLLVGLHERDPLLAVAKRLAVACYTTHCYVVGWDEQELTGALAGAHTPYLELGTL